MFIPHSEEEIKEMLSYLGLKSLDELFLSIPDDLKTKSEEEKIKVLKELDVRKELKKISCENKPISSYISFLGGGIYDHYIPACIDQIVLRSEYYTAYTPYQPEVSQGTLQAMFEFQSLICDLFKMDVSTASHYDGATALAEAIYILKKRGYKNCLISSGLSPFCWEVVKTYFLGQDINFIKIPLKQFVLDIDYLEKKAKEFENDFFLVFQTPNFFGFIEDSNTISQIVKKYNGKLIVSCDPISLAILKPPGDYDADLATAEGQSLGLYPSLGGPLLGILTSKKEYIRELPGRICGKTIDKEGKVGYVTVLQTREQHIRREKATSNICTNQQLCALRAAIYLSLMGKEGLKKVANFSFQKSHYLYENLLSLPIFEKVSDKPFFKEFTIKSKVPIKELINKCEKERIYAGIDLYEITKDESLKDTLLICVTEKRKKEEMDYFVEFLKRSF
ncbi:MAG: aminomethyl-transferring glycine dehydrogenase subunit GcvPA [candidate division WOR-3 bacterium]|nr:aminomethyl-transferring glycine dehydrogenase subunit GcvPA [candidate division WOR-3 bacterium]MCX7836466.1 aminomethyl-transferring glycine dehydrogenase subunit GcvPA [candidate division WOR-3 bacterium]MDW8114565.1 aminomethyl-transferring glycine dehydrogenase subunit GcvPA [candidate division WOR-3 bacterium]